MEYFPGEGGVLVQEFHVLDENEWGLDTVV
jgi:hypothetical protein